MTIIEPMAEEKSVVLDHTEVSSLGYKRAILQAIEKLHDYHTRSSLEAIRRHTQAVLDDTGRRWCEAMFLTTLKALVRQGEINWSAPICAELSPAYKRKLAHHLLERRVDRRMNPGSTTEPVMPRRYPHTATTATEHKVVVKDAPKRRIEHDKWKIMPKKIYDKTIIVNPMDTR